MIITRNQQMLLFKTLSAACSAQGITSATAKDAYRKRIMQEETGLTSLKYVNRTNEYEAIMRRLAEDAGDYQLAVHFAVGSEHRYSYLAEVCCQQLRQITSCHNDDTLSYVRGIIQQAGFKGQVKQGAWWYDLTESELYRLFSMLDTHRRRLLRKTDYRPLTFDPRIRYVILSTGYITIEPHDYSSAPMPIRFAV